MKSEELRHARAGFYIVDEGFDLVINGESPCRDPDDAIREAKRLHERTGRIYLVRQVLNVIDPRPPCVERSSSRNFASSCTRWCNASMSPSWNSSRSC